MAIISRIISFFMSIIMTLLSFFGINQRPDFILGDEVNSDTSQVIAIYNNAVKKSDTSSPEGEYYYNFRRKSYYHYNKICTIIQYINKIM